MSRSGPAMLAASDNRIVQALVQTRALRGFADGVISVALAGYLLSIGLDADRIGIMTTATLVGSAAGTLSLGVLAHRWPRMRLLLTAAVLMTMTGAGFLLIHDFWLLLPVAFLGTVNPSIGDVSVFLPLEQAEIAEHVDRDERTSVFARFSLAANLMAAAGALIAGGIAALTHRMDWDDSAVGRIGFVIYIAIGLVLLRRYASLPPGETPVRTAGRRGLERSRAIVFKLAAVFSLDSLGGGFVVQTMLILWLHQRHGMSEAAAGVLFSVTSLLSALSVLAAPAIARRFGLINTMVFTHLPANVFLMLAPLMPNLPLAVAMLLLRSSLSNMDVPARTAYVMAVVDPEERAAAASVTNVPRSLATAASPTIAGQLLTATAFGWPLIIGGACKVAYDLILWRMFRKVGEREI